MLSPFLTNFFVNGAWYASLFYIPLYWQAVDGVSATEAGVRLIPPIVCTVVGSLGGGIYMQKKGKFVTLTISSLVILLLGSLLILLSTLLPTYETSQAIPPLPLTILGASLAGLATGTAITTTLIALLSHSAKPDHATTIAVSYLFRSLGSTCGVALAATAANRVLRSGLEAELGARLGFDLEQVREVAEGVRRSLGYLRGLEPRVREVVVACYELGTRAALGVQVGFVVGAVGAGVFMREKAL